MKKLPTSIEWLIGLSLMFTLAIFMTISSRKSTESFFIWLTIFSGFIVWSGLLDLWILVLLIIVLVLLLFSNIRKGGGL